MSRREGLTVVPTPATRALVREPGARRAGLPGGGKGWPAVDGASTGEDGMSEHRLHPVAGIFPMLGEAELDALAADIRANGLREPVWRHRDGRVLDGRNRLEACRRAGVACPSRTFEGPDDELLDFVLSLNLHRRHLTEGQRAMVAARVATMGKGRPSRGENAGIQALTQVEAAERMGVSRDSVQKARKVLERGPPELVGTVDRDEVSLNRAVAQLPPAPAIIRPGPDDLRRFCTVPTWKGLDDATRHELLNPDPSWAQGRFTRQTGDEIEWAQESWGPVTGCEHECRVYCYAKEGSEDPRFASTFPFGFAPTLHPNRLLAPRLQRPPAAAATDARHRNIFVCSMADLFGHWVPEEWIEAVLREVRAAPDWTFLFLTKEPGRLVRFDFPDNTWIGTSVDYACRIPAAERAFARLRERWPRRGEGPVLWLSCEPMFDAMPFTRLDLWDWLVIGGASATRAVPDIDRRPGKPATPGWCPPPAWIEGLEAQARAAGVAIYEKTNLRGSRILELPRGLPVPQDPQEPPEVFRYMRRKPT